MATTYTTRNRLPMLAKGDFVDSWAAQEAIYKQLVDASLDGMATIALAALTTYTLTDEDGAADQARCRVLNFTGTQSCTITVPAVEKLYTIINGCDAGLSLTFTTGAGTTTAIPSGERAQIYVSSTGVQLVTSSREWRQSTSAGPSGATITNTIGTGAYFDSCQLELRQIGHDDGSSQNLMLALETSTGGTYGTAISILNTVNAVGTERVYGNITIENKGEYLDIIARVGKTGSFTNPLLQCTSTSFTASLAAMGSNRGIRLSWSGAVNFNTAQGTFVRFQR
jgi:hypothetical protein